MIPGRPSQEPSLHFICPRCEHTFLFTEETIRSHGAIVCPGCGLGFQGPPAGQTLREPLERCWICGCEEFYIQKDFNRDLGFLLVVCSAMVVLLIMLTIDHIVGIVCLLVLAALDAIVYRILANVTVCYKCQTIYRAVPLHPNHRGFYLGQEEKYKKLRKAWAAELTEGPAPRSST